MGAIEFRNFSCYYRHKKELIPALRGLTFSVEQGEFAAVVGASGSGKTTLLKACLGLAEFFDGELFIEGTPAEAVDIQKKNYAYISQEIVLFPNLTVYENIAFPLRMCHTKQKEVDKRVKELAEALGISLLLTRKPKQLSLGQQQRVALGRSLVKRPVMLFADEPFANLDPVLRRELGQLLKAYHRQYKSTVLFVTHDLQEADALADRVIELEDGVLASQEVAL